MRLTLQRAPRPLPALCLLALVALVAGCNSTQPPTASASAAAGECANPTAPGSIEGWNLTAKAPGIVPTIITTENICGPNRLLIGLSAVVKDSTGKQSIASVGAPDRSLKVALYDLAKDPKKPVISTDATFMWAIEGKTGIYVASVNYPEAGDWGAELTTSDKGGPPETIRVRFQVQPDGLMPGIGDTVPSVKTPTAADVGGDLRQIATDATPNPRFYQLSEDQALAQHKAFVLVFATPAFCTSAICGPTLDKIKSMAADYPNVTFINVEPYKMQFTGGRLQPLLNTDGQLQPNDASEAFNLISEPWIYVVDGQGRVTGSFETLAGPEELKAAIAAATKG
jgi:hypothetical protein